LLTAPRPASATFVTAPLVAVAALLDNSAILFPVVLSRAARVLRG